MSAIKTHYVFEIIKAEGNGRENPGDYVNFVDDLNSLGIIISMCLKRHKAIVLWSVLPSFWR